MIVGVVVLVVLAAWVMARMRRRNKRETSADALGLMLDVQRPYKGPRWKVGDRWL